jgi:hypothetical protein
MNLPNARSARQRNLVLNPVEITRRCSTRLTRPILSFQVAKEEDCVGAWTIGYFWPGVAESDATLRFCDCPNFAW